MENAEAKLNIKLTQLDLTVKRTHSILEAGQSEAIERQLATLKTMTGELDQLQIEAEAQKIANKQNVDEIITWNTTIATKLAQADECIGKLIRWLEDQKTERQNREREQQIRFEVKLHETKAKLQADLKVKTNKDNQVRKEVGQIKAKLPKLVITKFDGSYTDWNRFQGQFSETINKTSVSAFTKFAYLRELLCDKVKRTVEALPYTPEGYDRAKAIFLERYGKESEIIKAYVKEILELPHIPTANVKRIHESSEKLIYNVQSLQT